MRYLAIFLLLACGVLGCGGDRAKPVPPAGSVVRVGYFATPMHAQALVGIARGDFASALGARVKIESTVFNAGPSAIEAIFANRIDLAYVGPNPAINGYVQSRGRALRIVAGAMSGGASLVVRGDAGIESPEQLDGKRIATPQLGNTQDVALRAFIAGHGLKPKENGGTVDITPTPSAEILELVKSKQLDGAWVPEPWASRLVVEEGCRVLVDERDLWPGGDFVTAQVIVRTDYLAAHSEIVRAWIDAHVRITNWLVANPTDAKHVINIELTKLNGKPLTTEVMDAAWSHMRPTVDPIQSSLAACASSAYAAGFLRRKPDLAGIYDLNLLDDVIGSVRSSHD